MAPHPNLEWHIIALAGSCSGLELIDHYWTTKVRSEVFPLARIPYSPPPPHQKWVSLHSELRVPYELTLSSQLLPRTATPPLPTVVV